MRSTRSSRRGLTRQRRRRGSRGAALVEFALVALPLFMLLFGMIEFSWTFYQLNDVRHGAREGIRLVAVNADRTTTYTGLDMNTKGKKLAQAACERMDQRKNVTITLSIADLDSNGKYDVGDDATLVAAKPVDQITGMFGSILNTVVLDETITTRLEQSWWSDAPANANVVWPCK